MGTCASYQSESVQIENSHQDEQHPDQQRESKIANNPPEHDHEDMDDFKQHPENHLVYFIGNNNKEINYVNKTILDLKRKKIQSWADSSIINIHSGSSFTIYSEISIDGNTKYWGCGSNNLGQLGIGNITYQPILDSNITFFTINNIKIEKVCINSAASTIFWISSENKVYGHGDDGCGQLGLGHSGRAIDTPQLIKYFDTMYKVLDVQSMSSMHIALCSSNSDIDILVLNWWINSYQIDLLPDDIINLILAFNAVNTVHSSRNYLWVKCGKGNMVWDKVKAFDDKNIIKIRGGNCFALCLDSNGNVWSFGHANSFGQLGLGHMDDVIIRGKSEYIRMPVKIEYFTSNMIKIKDIACGYSYCLAIDQNGKVYSWGLNTYFQCGHSKERIVTPTLIEYFDHENCKINVIQCGSRHSYCKSLDNKHYLFGNNNCNQCITYDQRLKVKVPHCINQIIVKKTRCKNIISISLGFNNTKIIVSNKLSQ